MLIKDTLIVINSSNRVDKVVTPALFPDDIIDWVIAVPFDQWDMYNAKFPDERLKGIPSTIPQFLPAQRQWVMERYGAEFKNIWLMDDDLCFFTRNEENLLRKSTTDEISRMMMDMRQNLIDVPMVGISTRLGNNRVTAAYDEINRVTRCYAMSTSVFKQVGATFSPFNEFTNEDFHMALCFLNAGFKNRILHTYAQEDVGGSNAEGGCSIYRTAEVQKRTAFWMSENHPEVKVKGKYSKGGTWELQKLDDGRNYRVDVIVQWKQAYKPKKVRSGSGFNFSKKG